MKMGFLRMFECFNIVLVRYRFIVFNGSWIFVWFVMNKEFNVKSNCFYEMVGLKFFNYKV